MHVCLLTWHSWYSVKFRNCISGCVQATKIVHIGLAYSLLSTRDHHVQDSCSNWGDGQSIFKSISKASKARLFEFFFSIYFIENKLLISKVFWRYEFFGVSVGSILKKCRFHWLNLHMTYIKTNYWRLILWDFTFHNNITNF